MSFSFPFFLKNGSKTKRDDFYKNNDNNNCDNNSGINSNTSSNSSNQGNNLSSSSLRDQVYPTLASMVQAKTSPDPSPTSSSSSRTRPISVPLSSPPLAPEELEDNSFYIYLRSHFNTIFTRSIVVCIPHSRSLEGLVLTKDFIETHCYNSSPYYRGQYQAANGKVISIEQPLISSVSGFKEQRTVHIMSEEWVYIGNKKIRVYMIQRPLEGEASQLQKSRNTINIPICRNSKSDFDFLNMFAENVEPLLELQSAVQEFVDTYVYIRGFNNYTVEKIQHIYTKAYKTILQRNKLLRDACRIQAEHDHFLELVENVIMGFLHEKIWIQSLRSVLQSQDAYLYSICECYSKDNITLQRYTVSYPISEMPLSCFDQAIACLRQTDADNDVSLSSNCNVDNNTIVTTSLAFTPLEKIVCVKSTLDLITKAVDDYANELKNGSSNSESSVTTDEMIPLLAYVITHARISRIASLAFYMEHFRLSHMERSEHGFALATLKTAISYLKGDPLSLLDASSNVSTVSTNSTSSTALSPPLKNLRSRSTSFGSPHNAQLYNHYPSSPSYRSSSYQSTQLNKSTLPSNVIPNSSSQRIPTRMLRHRKSQSADLQCMLDTQQQSRDDSDKDDSYQDTNRHKPLTPKIRSAIILKTPSENRRSLDITNDWMIHNNDSNRSSPDFFSTSFDLPHQQHHQSHQQHNHHAKPSTPPKHVLGHTQPMISTTLPTISNSTPLPGNSPPNSSASQQYYYYRHQQYHRDSARLSLKKKESCLYNTTEEDNNNSNNDSGNPTPLSSPKPVSSPSRMVYFTNNDLEYPTTFNNASNKLGRSLSSSTVKQYLPVSKTTNYQYQQQQQPPTVIQIPERLSFDGIGRRPASICIDTRSSSIHHGRSRDSDQTQEDLGDFLSGLQNMDGDVVGEYTGGQTRMC